MHFYTMESGAKHWTSMNKLVVINPEVVLGTYLSCVYINTPGEGCMEADWHAGWKSQCFSYRKQRMNRVWISEQKCLKENPPRAEITSRPSSDMVRRGRRTKEIKRWSTQNRCHEGIDRWLHTARQITVNSVLLPPFLFELWNYLWRFDFLKVVLSPGAALRSSKCSLCEGTRWPHISVSPSWRLVWWDSEAPSLRSTDRKSVV